jgi:hypothetical protein
MNNDPIKGVGSLAWDNLEVFYYGRSSIKIAHFVPIHLQTWPPKAILVSD